MLIAGAFLLVLLVLGVLVVGSSGGGGSSDSSAKLGGFLGVTSDTVIFVQWTRTKDSLTGSAEVANVQNGTQLQQDDTPFTGVVSGKNVSLAFHFGPTWNGTLDGSDLTLSGPGNDGSLETFSLHPATLAEYQSAVAQMQSRANTTASSIAKAQQDAVQAAAEAKQRADEAEQAATAQAAAHLLAKYEASCKAHGGLLSATVPDELGYDAPRSNSAGQYCVVSFSGQGSFEVPVSADEGTFVQAAANENRRQCDSDAADAKSNAADGFPWAKPPQYHALQGVCYQGQR